MENTMYTPKSGVTKFKAKSPCLFSIPMNIYSDEVERERDKESFIKIQQLQKKCEQLRQKLHAYTEQHSQRLETTRYLVLRTIAFKKDLWVRKVEYKPILWEGGPK